jgi:hypothetical protein
MRKSYYVIVGLFVYLGTCLSVRAFTYEQIEQRNQRYEQSEAQRFQEAQHKYCLIMQGKLLTDSLPCYEDAMLDALITEGFARKTFLGHTVGLYIKDLKRVVELSPKVSGATMRCVLTHLFLQKGTGVVVKETCDENNSTHIMPITALDITRAREYFPSQIMNSKHPGSYALDLFLTDQLYKKLPRQ